VSGESFSPGREYTLDQVDSVPKLSEDEDVVLCALVDDAIRKRTDEGAASQQQLDAIEALLGENEEFGDLLNRLRALIDAGEAKELERFAAYVNRNGDANR
jgi:hypothetical protein